MVCEKLQAESVIAVPSPWHVVFFIFNIFFPGWGTIISSFCGASFSGMALLVGILQFILAPFLLGWIWSIVWGWLIYKKSEG